MLRTQAYPYRAVRAFRGTPRFSRPGCLGRDPLQGAPVANRDTSGT